MKKDLFLAIIIFGHTLNLYCQESVTISGYVTDKENGEKIIGAIVIDSLTSNTSETNNYGFFSFKTFPGVHYIRPTYVGYKGQTLKLNCTKDTLVEIYLVNNSVIDQVVINAENPNKIQSFSHPELKTIPMKMVKALPSIMGERDVLRTLQILPGVQSGSEANTGLYVRGGESGDNLVLLDGIEVVNANHLFGFFSLFNDDAIKSVKFYSSGYPAIYNGRLASVVDIRTKDGNSQKTRVRGSLGLISSKLQVEGPVLKDKMTYVVSFRRTYLDIFPKSFVRHFTDYTEASYYFYDLNARLHWKINDKNNLYLSNYAGKDNGFFQTDNKHGNNPPEESEGFIQALTRKDFDWGNNLFMLRYEHLVSKNLFVNVSAGISKYKYSGKERNFNLALYWQNDSLKQSKNDNIFKTHSEVKIYSFSIDFEHYLNTSNHLTYGIGSKVYQVNPSLENIQITDTSGNLGSLYSHSYYVYFQDDIRLWDKLVVRPGININYYKAKNISRPRYDKRLVLSYQLTEKLGINIEYADMTQYLQLLTLSKISLSSDLWLPSYNKIKPSESIDKSIGFSYSPSNSLSICTKFYKRDYKNLLAYKEGFSVIDNYNDFSDMTTSGTGTSRGIEISIEKSLGIITGMMSYCYSSSERTFKEINQGETFKAEYDRPHNFKLFITAAIGKKWTIGAVFNIMSGSMLTMGNGKYGTWFNYGENPWSNVTYGSTDMTKIIVYKKNSYRLPVYHRLDLSATYSLKKNKYSSSLNFGLYNAYNAKNVYDVQLEFIGYDSSTGKEIYKLVNKSLFPLIPYIGYNFEF